MKFLSIATALTLLSVTVSAQSATNTSTTTTTSTETYPAEGAVPTPKAEWMDLIKSANITNAPVLKSNGADGPNTSGEDKYCDWAFSGCLGDSIATCPKGQWGITFDDGPSDVSPVLYDFLKSTNQKATLFMIGANAVKFPEHVKRAYEEGHEIAIHTWSHPYMTTLTNEQVVAELKWTELAIKNIIGVSPHLFRPPYGDIDNRVRDIGNALGFRSVIWDHDSEDWMLAEQASFKAEWIDGNFTQWISEAATSSTGGLSLEHDIQNVTVQAAIKNLPALQKAYKVIPVGECAGVASYKESTNVTTTTSSSASVVASTSAPAVSSVAVTPAATTAASVDNTNQSQNTSGSMRNTVTNSVLLLSAALSYYFA